MTATDPNGIVIASTDPISPPEPATGPKPAAAKKAAPAAAEKKLRADLPAAGDVATPAAALATTPAPATPALAAPASATEEGERNAVFSSLVKGDTDVVGLVAYSIYKQNKHDWLVAFRRQRGREPDDVELSAYIIGEATARRLVTYRHLAEATIAGRGPEVSFAPGQETGARHAIRPIPRQDRPAGLPVWMFVALAAVSLALVLLAARYGLPGVTPAR